MSEVPPEIDPREFAKKLREHRETQPQGIVQKAADAAKQEIRRYRRREHKELRDEEVDEIITAVESAREAMARILIPPLETLDDQTGLRSTRAALEMDQQFRRTWQARFRAQRSSLFDRIEQLFTQVSLDGPFLPFLRATTSFAEIVLRHSPPTTWDSELHRVGAEERVGRWRNQLTQAKTTPASSSNPGGGPGGEPAGQKTEGNQLESLEDPIRVSWLRTVVPQKVVKGASDKLAKWLKSRGVKVVKIANRLHAERKEVRRAFARHRTILEFLDENGDDSSDESDFAGD